MALNVFELFAKIGLDTSEYDKGLNESKSKLSSVGNFISKGLGMAASAGVAAIGAASAAVAGLSKEALSSYKDYEQLEGGVKKLYGNMGLSVEEYAKQNNKSVSEVQNEWQKLEDAQNEVLKNAQNAYKTAGMSANQYMETATSFSASLIKSLDGDTKKAAELTDIAMQAISDNYNTFGGDIGMIQGAFQGFAKQNYTMLDNLKLGYGGTKTEMEKLIKDAASYKDIQEKLNLTVDEGSMSFDNIVKAIQVVQEKQQIAGTTAREAMTTIEGSANATKAAWEDVIIAIGRGEGIEDAFNGLVNSIFGEKEGEGLLNQIIPRIQQVFEGIATFVEQAGPLFADKIPVLIESVLPTVLESAFTLISSLAEGLINALPLVTGSALQIGLGVLNTLMGLLPDVAALAIQMVGSLATSIGDAASELIPNAVNAIIDTIISILENADALVDGAVSLVMGLTDGIINALPILLDRLPEVIVKLTEALILNAPKLESVGPQLILALVQGLISALPELLTMGPKIVVGLLESFMNNAPQMAEGGISQMKSLIQGIVETIPDLLALPFEIVSQMVSAYASAAPNLIESGQALVEAVGEGFSNLIDNAAQWGADLIDSFVSGIMDNVDRVIRAAEGVASSIQDIIGFSEPKKGPLSRFHTFAPDMMELFAKGIKDNTDLVTDQVKNSFSFDDVIKDQNYNNAFDVSGSPSINMGGGFVQNLTINAPEQLNPSEIARQTRNANREFVLSMRMA